MVPSVNFSFIYLFLKWNTDTHTGEFLILKR